MAVTSAFNWTNWLNDSMELSKKQSQRCSRRRSRQLFSKIRNMPTPQKRGSKLAPHQRFLSKRILASRGSTPKKSCEKVNNKWKTEYDIWNIMTETIDQHLVGNHKINWNNKEIGVRDSTNNIRLVKNRQELNQLILVNSSSGRKTHANNLMNPNDSDSNVSLKIEFALVPVIKGFQVVHGTDAQAYAVDSKSKDMNNNDIECVSDGIESDESAEDSDIEPEHTLTSSSEVQQITAEYTNMSFDDTTITNESFVCDYSEFLSDLIDTRASSTLISEKENIPVFSTPTR